MYYTNTYWVTLLEADDERRSAYEKAVRSGKSHASIAADVKTADAIFDRRMKDASQAADAQIVMEARRRVAHEEAGEALAAPERLARHREAEDAERLARKQQSDKLEPVVRQNVDAR